VGGTDATAELVLVIVTAVAPPIAEASVTVACTDWPPTTRVWASVSEASCRPAGAGSVTVSRANCERPLYEALIVTATANGTVCAVTVNVAVDAPAATVTLAGTVARVTSSLDSATVAPPAGATPLSVTVPVTVLPLLTSVEESVTEASVATPATGLTFSTAVCVTWPAVAEMAAKSAAATG
jgi:hypothetical protein